MVSFSQRIRHHKKKENIPVLFNFPNKKQMFLFKISILCVLFSVLITGCINTNNTESDPFGVANDDESKPIPPDLPNNKTYKQAIEDLRETGYKPSTGSLIITHNETRVVELFRTPDGKNATVTSVIRNGTVEEVTVKKEETVPVGWYLGFVLLLILACLCAWAGYRYYLKRTLHTDPEPADLIKEPRDIRRETEEILIRAEALFSERKEKDAYALAGQGLRFYLSHILGTGTADTNGEIISLMKKNGKDSREVQNILNRCVMVEFAKSDGEEEEFRSIVSGIRNIVNQSAYPEPENSEA